MTIAGDPVIRTAAGVADTSSGQVTAVAPERAVPILGPIGRTLAAPGSVRPPLTPIALLDVAKEYATRTSAWSDRQEGPLVERTYELLELTDDVEVWVIHWPTGGHLELHDHGGSAGAFWVMGGTLEERYVTDDRSLRRRRISAASGTGFGSRYVHDVRNGGDQPATSVHAYSPPMPGMTFYRATPTGLAAERTEYRSDPSWAP